MGKLKSVEELLATVEKLLHSRRLPIDQLKPMQRPAWPVGPCYCTRARVAALSSTMDNRVLGEADSGMLRRYPHAVPTQRCAHECSRRRGHSSTAPEAYG
jgi:hypothetical protein